MDCSMSECGQDVESLLKKKPYLLIQKLLEQ